MHCMVFSGKFYSIGRECSVGGGKDMPNVNQSPKLQGKDDFLQLKKEIIWTNQKLPLVIYIL